MMLIKILGAGVFWICYSFFVIVSAALMSGSPSANLDNVMKVATTLTFLPVLIFYIYRAIRVYFLHSGVFFRVEDIYFVIIPAVLAALFVYNSK